MSIAMPHLRVLEFWRLSAAIAVMCYHFLKYAPGDPHHALAVLYRLLPLMDMFFMISGFLIMLRYGDELLASAGSYRRFIVRRFVRIYPLYLATLLFFVAVGIAVQAGIVSTGWPARYDFSVLPHNLLLIQGWGTTDDLSFNYVGWTLSAEWFCYLVFPVVVLAFRHYGAAGLAVLAGATVLALEAASALRIVPFETWFETNTWGAYRAFADFAIGALVAVAVRDGRFRMRSHLPGWLVFAASIACMLAQQNSYLIFALLVSAIYLSARAEVDNPEGSRLLRPLHPVGRVSFGIYLIHPVVETLFISILWRMVIEPTQAIGFFAYWYLPMAVSIVLALLSERYFETPAARWLGAIAPPGNRRTGPASVR